MNILKPVATNEPLSGKIHRRAFLKLGLSVSAVSDFRSQASARPKLPVHLPAVIDVNVNLSRWPLRRLKGDDPAVLAGMLRSQGVARAWAGTFDGLLHKDIRSANAALAAECRRHGRGLLLPFGTINPQLPGWEEDLRQCVHEHRMAGIRLHPNYHGYRLEEPQFGRVLQLASEHRLIVQLALLMEDERMMHPRLRVEPVDPAALPEILARTPEVQLVLLNALGKLKSKALQNLFTAGNVYVEISMLEGVGAVAQLLQEAPLNRILFGSHAPLFYLESAMLKLCESPLDQQQLRAICSGNAQRLIGD